MHVQTHSLRGYLDVLIQEEMFRANTSTLAGSPACSVSEWVLICSFRLQICGRATEWNIIGRHSTDNSGHTFVVTQRRRKWGTLCLHLKLLTPSYNIHTLIDDCITSWHLFSFGCLLQHSLFSSVVLQVCCQERCGRWPRTAGAWPVTTWARSYPSPSSAQ